MALSHIPAVQPDFTARVESRPEAAPSVVGYPRSPILPGWLIAWRDPSQRLRGGAAEREHGTVARTAYGSTGWLVHLTDGTVLTMAVMRSIASTDAQGAVTAAWEVRTCGLDGEGTL